MAEKVARLMPVARASAARPRAEGSLSIAVAMAAGRPAIWARGRGEIVRRARRVQQPLGLDGRAFGRPLGLVAGEDRVLHRRRREQEEFVEQRQREILAVAEKRAASTARLGPAISRTIFSKQRHEGRAHRTGILRRPVEQDIRHLVGQMGALARALRGEFQKVAEAFFRCRHRGHPRKA